MKNCSQLLYLVSLILGMIGCKKNPKYAPKDPFPQKVKDLCKTDEELIKSTGITKGAFNNYVDQILTNVDHLPPSSGKLRTFYILPTL